MTRWAAFEEDRGERRQDFEELEKPLDTCPSCGDRDWQYVGEWVWRCRSEVKGYLCGEEVTIKLW